MLRPYTHPHLFPYNWNLWKPLRGGSHVGKIDVDETDSRIKYTVQLPIGLQQDELKIRANRDGYVTIEINMNTCKEEKTENGHFKICSRNDTKNTIKMKECCDYTKLSGEIINNKLVLTVPKKR